jgi:hypothetical protein
MTEDSALAAIVMGSARLDTADEPAAAPLPVQACPEPATVVDLA